MQPADLYEAVRQHTGTFACHGLSQPAQAKDVAFTHRTTPPVDNLEEVPDVGQLRAFYATFGSLLLYHDAVSGDAARHIAPPSEWAELHSAFSGWPDNLDEDERAEILPDWLDTCLVIGEAPRTGNYLLVPTEGECAGHVFEFDHDGFEFTDQASDLLAYVQGLLDLDGQTLVGIASHMRFVEGGDWSVQWWIVEMRDNRGNVVTTQA